MCRVESFTVVGKPSRRCIWSVPGRGRNAFTPSRFVFGICVAVCFRGLVVNRACLLTMSRTVCSVARCALLAVCVTFLSILGQMFRFMNLTCLGCHLLWYFKGIGILVVVRGVVHRVFKGFCVGPCALAWILLCNVMR